jgi:carbon monoxide dehydrogenase subunit G
VKIEDEFDVVCPIERMYSEINNIGEIGYCIAGVKEIRTISDDESEWTIEARAGIMARTFRIRGLITERRPPEGITFTGRAPEVKIAGSVRLSAVDETTTRCAVSVEFEVIGAFKPLVDQMAKGPQQRMIRETIANLRGRLDVVAAGGTPPRPVVPAPAPAPDRLSPLLLRARQWWGRRRDDEALASIQARLDAIEAELKRLHQRLDEPRAGARRSRIGGAAGAVRPANQLAPAILPKDPAAGAARSTRSTPLTSGSAR